MTQFQIGDQLGIDQKYTIVHASPQRSGWHVKDKQGQLWYLRTQEIPLPAHVDLDRLKREQKSILREAERWQGLHIARPEVKYIFWHHRYLCWIEAILQGAALSSLTQPLQTIEAFFLLEECLYALQQLHKNQDFKTGEPLLHLNLNDKNIWRGTHGGLYLLNPILPQWIELQHRFTPNVLKATSAHLAPELRRGRCGMSSDVYALGMCVLTGLTQMNVETVDQRLQSGSLFEHDIEAPDSFKALLSQMTEFRASQRFLSAELALKALRDLPHADIQSMHIQMNQYTQEQARLARDMNEEKEAVAEILSDKINAQTQEVAPVVSTPLVTPNANQTENTLSSSESISHTHDLSKTTQSDSQEVYELILKDDIEDTPMFYVKSEGEHHHEAVEVLAVSDTRQNINRILMIVSGLLFILALGYFWGSSHTNYTTPTQQSKLKHSDQLLKLQAVDTVTQKKSRLKSKTSPESVNNDLTETSVESKSQFHTAQLHWISIQAGQATIGSLPNEGYASEHPQRTVDVVAFEISKSEVTVLQYAQCVAQGACGVEGLQKPDWGASQLCNWDKVGRWHYPMNCLTWHQAHIFAQWVRGRLPSEVEWSYAAKSQGRFQNYPWGDQDSADCQKAILADVIKGDGCGQMMTWPVCSRPLGNTKQGLCDMIGNVWEWMEDEGHTDYSNAPLSSEAWISSPPDRWQEMPRMYRGGGAFDERDLPRIARRGQREPQTRLFTLGFRVVRSKLVE